MATAKARKGKARAIVDTSTAVAESEVAAVYRIRSKPSEGVAKESYADSGEDDDDEIVHKKAIDVVGTKRKPPGTKNFLEEKRKWKARKREEQSMLPQAPQNGAQYVHVKVLCDPLGLTTALVRQQFPDAVSLEVAERMHWAWITLPSVESASNAIASGSIQIAGVPGKVDKGKNAPEEIFVSFGGRKVLGAFLNEHFHGVKDVTEAMENALRARFLTKEAAKAAIKKGPITVLNGFTLCAEGEWGKEQKIADF